MNKSTRRNFVISSLAAGIGIYFARNVIHETIDDLFDYNTPFEYTGKETTKGYDIFRIKDAFRGTSQRSQTEISNAFDNWDKSQGDNYANTGSLNIRMIDGELVIVANPYEKKEPEIKKIRRSSSKPYTKIDRENVQIKEDLKRGKYNKRFLDKVDQICAELDMSAMGLMAVMNYETIGSFRPNITNRDSGAIGLIQILPEHAAEYGTTAEKLKKMTAIEQLDVVKTYFKVKEKYHKKQIDFSRPHNIALTVFYPGALNDPSASIGDRNSKNYRQNSHLDDENKGYITGKDYVSGFLSKGKYLIK